MRTGKLATRAAFGASIIFCLLGAGTAGPGLAQTSTTTTMTNTSPKSTSHITTMPDGAKVRDSTTSQVPDESTPATTTTTTTTTYNLADLLREENKRLKQRVSILEKENADLKAKLSGK
jgi:hypothetical protein